MTDTIADLRAEARRLFDIAIAAADPGAALRRKFRAPQPGADGRVIVVAIGKAACPMLAEALALLKSTWSGPVTAFGITNYENAVEVPGAEIRAAGHPVPDANGHAAAQALAQLIGSARAQDRVVALISGGGSALAPLPVPGVTLAQKARVNEVLLGAGFDIAQMNLIRQQLSQLKGGGLLRHAAPAPVEAYILSDVVGDNLRVIASGPTVAPIGTKADARALLEPVWASLPASVTAHLSTADSPSRLPEAQNHLICSNRISLNAVAAAHPGARIIDDRLEGNVAEVAPKLAAILNDAPSGAALLFGGETTVTLTGTGKGGRNQDLALRMALADIPGAWVFLSGGTDGRDGPTDAAGGLVDAGTAQRIREAGHDGGALLANNDAYPALGAAGDLVMTGGTGTNVADVQIMLKA